MKWRRLAILIVGLVSLALLGVAGSESKRLRAALNQECYMDIGGSKIWLRGITSKCFIQNYGPGKLFVLVSDTRVYFTICGTDYEMAPERGYNFIHFIKGNPEPLIAPVWEELCGTAELVRDGYFPGNAETETYFQSYRKTISSFAITTVPVSGGTFESLYDSDLDKLYDIRNDFINADQVLMTRAELDALVREYRFPNAGS